MTLGEKISILRKENNYTQEQLAGLLNVSRQSISKWESDISYPETDKIIKLSKLFNCSLDYLLKDDVNVRNSETKEKVVNISFKPFNYERKSKKTIRGIPLWHITLGSRKTAKGIIAIGIKAKGIVSMGLISMGIISFGLLPLGVIGIGVLSLGLLSIGSVAFGVVAIGAISVGIISIGALAIGEFSVGALAIGKYVAIGDEANALIAIGQSKATGSIYEKVGELTSSERKEVIKLMKDNIPNYFNWAKEFIKFFL